MDHSVGQARFKDGTIKFFEYNGNCDCIHSILVDTYEEMRDNWKKDVEPPRCKCITEPVEFYTCYGGGIIWTGTACKRCGRVLSIDYTNGKDFESRTPRWVLNIGEQKLIIKIKKEVEKDV